jgi:hypothetical protein
MGEIPFPPNPSSFYQRGLIGVVEKLELPLKEQKKIVYLIISLCLISKRERHTLIENTNSLRKAFNIKILFSLHYLRDIIILTNHIKINLNSNLSLNGASRASI